MTQALSNIFHSFLHENYRSGPLLLALSGGPDSLALYDLLIQTNFPFIVAHVDHGWRKESAQEALTLKEMVEGDSIPFFQIQLKMDPLASNIEALARDERLLFFSTLYKQHSCRALLLAQHADDLAETVIKRVFEGATLSKLHGIRPARLFMEGNLKGMILWRPLLKARKKEILTYLKARHLSPFEDPSNKDLRFLRSRMRQTMIPDLKQQFGKEITNNLAHLANESMEMAAYFEEKFTEILSSVEKGPMGLFLDLNPFWPLHSFEVKQLLPLFCPYSLNHTELRTVLNALLQGKANLRFPLKVGLLYLDRRRLFFFPHAPVSFPASWVSLQEGRRISGPWSLYVEPLTASVTAKAPPSWKSVWKGEYSLILPVGNYTFTSPSRSLDKRWTKQRIPAIFRSMAPVLKDESEQFFECLSGMCTQDQSKHFWNLRIRYAISE